MLREVKAYLLLGFFSVLCSAIVAESFPQEVSFIARRDYPVGVNPISVAYGDFDNNGIPDLVVANVGHGPQPGDLSFFLGNGDGTIRPAGSYALEGKPHRVLVDEFNEDGNLDLAVLHQYGLVSILLGNGNGTFRSRRDYQIRGDVWMAAGDFNGDGHRDLVAVGRLPFVSVLLGEGDGRFTTQEFFFNGLPLISVTVGDLNEDGIADLIVGVEFGVGFLLGNGDGSFQPVQYLMSSSGDHIIPPLIPSQFIAVDDFDGDGHSDLAVLNSDRVTILLGNGDGTFPRRMETLVRIGFGWDMSLYALASGDLNGDEKPDLVIVGNGLPGVAILLGNGDGRFQVAGGFTAGGYPTSVALADCNGDERPDILVTNLNVYPFPMVPIVGGVSVALGYGDGRFRGIRGYGEAGSSQAITAGDFNNDGRLDLAWVSDSGSVYFLLSRPDGDFTQSSLSLGSPLRSITTADFNHDGNLDLMVADDQSGTIFVLLGQGDGRFQPARSLSRYWKPVVGDFNGDGILDLAVTSYDMDNRYISVLFGNGNGSFPTARRFVAPQADVRSLGAGDFNGDGALDLAVVGSSQVALLLGNGDGSFQSARYSPMVIEPFSPTVLVEDFNQDGRLDLAVASSGRAVSILLGSEFGFDYPRPTYFPQTMTAFAVGDFNGDGLPDLAVALRDWNAVAIRLGTGSGTFDATYYFGVGFAPSALAVDDFNADGRPDLAVAYGTSLRTSLLINEGP